MRPKPLIPTFTGAILLGSSSGRAPRDLSVRAHHYLYPVPIGVTQEGRVVVGTVVGSIARRPVVGPTGGHAPLPRRLDGGDRVRRKADLAAARDGLAVAG